MAFTTVPITATYLKEDGTPASGTVVFTRTKTLIDSSNNQIASPVDLTAHLDANGHISVQLIANDDATTQPTGTTYKVTENIRSAKKNVYLMTVPHTAVTLDLADVIPAVQGPQNFSYASQSALTDEINARTAADNALQADIDAKPDTFLELTDTPNAYTGQGGKVVAVKSDTTGLEFIAGGGGGGATLSDNNPAALATSAAPGVGTLASRDDHVHPTTGLATSAQLSTEQTTRASADTTLQTNITAEATARANADTTEATARAGVQTNLNTHAALTTTAHGGIVASTDPRLTDARTPTAHTQAASTITDFVEAAQDAIGAALAANADIVPDYSDVSNTISFGLADVGVSGDQRAFTLQFDSKGRVLGTVPGWPYTDRLNSNPPWSRNDLGYSFDASAGDVIIDLPAIADLDLNMWWIVRREDDTANLLTFTPQGSDTVVLPFGAGSFQLQGAGAAFILWANSARSEWTVLGLVGLGTGHSQPLGHSPDIGTSGLAARADHSHDMPTAAQVGAPVLSDSSPSALGAASPGADTEASRSDHIHPAPSPADIGAAAASHTHTESGLSLSDTTSQNATTARHGFLKKLSNVANQYMNGLGNWAQPSHSDLSDWDEAVQDTVGAMLVAGTGITVTYNDPAGTATIAATGGSGVDVLGVQVFS